MTRTVADHTATASTRSWLTAAHAELADLLPGGGTETLLTDDMTTADGSPVDVYKHFGIKPSQLRKLAGNFNGIKYTAQGASQDYHVDEVAPAWPGFHDVWVPIESRLSLAGRLGYATRDGRTLDADCIVILPGFFGDNGVQRTCDLAHFLRDAGFHVLALEIRGHGQTEASYPNMNHTFGVMETDDLMQVSDWLTSDPHVRRTGLIGFCWGANIALLSAWFDGHDPADPGITPTLRKHLLAKPGRRRFTAGIMAFSPVVDWESLMDELDTPRSYLADPVYAAIQNICRYRCKRKGYPDDSGSLRNLIRYEYEAQDVRLPAGYQEGFRFLRFLPHNGAPADDKLESARMPVLIVHACNDPLSPAQNIARLMSTVQNPRVAAMILPDGGHVGFAAYCSTYYYSLIANFFDPVYGAASGITPSEIHIQAKAPAGSTVIGGAAAIAAEAIR